MKKADIANFQTLVQAARGGKLFLFECRRRADQKMVAVLCIINEIGVNGSSTYHVTPMATMGEGNLYKLFDPPNPNGGLHGFLSG